MGERQIPEMTHDEARRRLEEINYELRDRRIGIDRRQRLEAERDVIDGVHGVTRRGVVKVLIAVVGLTGAGVALTNTLLRAAVDKEKDEAAK